MNEISEKLIINGNIKTQVKDDLGYVLFQFKEENPGKRITQARKVVETTLKDDYGFSLDTLDIELSESINFIKLEINEKVEALLLTKE
jgi:hypothetical protein